MLASTIAPMAMAIPPRDIIFALIPCTDIARQASKRAIGRLTIATSADRKWYKNTAHTKAITINSWMSLLDRSFIARLISVDRSYTVSRLTPAGRLGFIFSSFALTASIVA